MPQNQPRMMFLQPGMRDCAKYICPMQKLIENNFLFSFMESKENMQIFMLKQSQNPSNPRQLTQTPNDVK